VLARLPFGREHLVFVIAGLIGCAGALSTILFRECLRHLQWWLSGTDQGLVATARALPWWARLLVPTVGGLLAGITLQVGLKWIPRKGSEDYMEAIAVGDGVLSARQSLVRSASSLCSVASGASIGREGPMVQLAAMCGSLLGRVLRRATPVSVEQLRLLVACGAAAGITSAYNAPISGAVFVSEIVFGVITTATLGPLLVSAVTADIVLRQFFGYGAVYEMPHFDFVSGWEVLSFRKSSRSLPAVNTPDPPVMIMQRMPGLLWAVSIASLIARYISWVIAFFFSGRRNVITRVASSSVTISWPGMMLSFGRAACSRWRDFRLQLTSSGRPPQTGRPPFSRAAG